MNKVIKIGIVVALVIVVGVVIAMKNRQVDPAPNETTQPKPTNQPVPKPTTGVPRLVDLGASACIPCKMMAPILEELKQDYAGRLRVDFYDVWKRPGVGREYGIRIIPTQIFYDPKGKELWRHEGFLSKEDILGKWKELGYDFGGTELPRIERWEPASNDDRTKDQVCYMCDGDVNARMAVVVKTDKGDVRLCSLHCYFIMYSCLTDPRQKSRIHDTTSVTDWAAGRLVPAESAVYLRGVDAKGRPTVKAFASKGAALKQRSASGGNVISYEVLGRKELSHRCGFCDRAVYPEDSSLVKVAGVHTWGCCPHCALGVAARTGKDIEVFQPDALTGKMIVVRTLDGQVASLEPKTTVAWFGMRKKPDGKWGSAGCFHQANFTTVENLKKWLEQHRYEMGKLIPIAQALAAKMKMTPQQISKACKIGECKPK